MVINQNHFSQIPQPFFQNNSRVLDLLPAQQKRGIVEAISEDADAGELQVRNFAGFKRVKVDAPPFIRSMGCYPRESWGIWE